MNEKKAPRIYELGLVEIISIYQQPLFLPIEFGSFFYNKLNVQDHVDIAETSSIENVSLLEAQPFDINALEPELAQALKCIASPEMFITLKVGGGGTGLERLQVHQNMGVLSGLAVIVESGKDIFSILVFDTIADVVYWIVDTLGCKHMDSMPNFMPPKIQMEEFLFLLHAIDTFRRRSYVNLLEHKVEEKITLSYSEFMEDMSSSIASGDMRWLLPAFIILTPGVIEYELDLTYEHANKLFQLGFLEFAGKTENDEYIVSFGEAGLISGVEFFRTWLMGIGIEAKVKRDSQVFAIERLFIAPTAVANHFVRMEYNEAGKVFINHQTFTKEQLENKLTELFSTIV